MGGSPKPGNPWAPRPWPWVGVGSQLEQPTLVSNSIELQPAPLMQPLCQACKRVPAYYLETFLLEIAIWQLSPSLHSLPSQTTRAVHRRFP